MRIVSLAPSNTEILFALGLLDQVVGVDNYSDWPPALVGSLPRVGPDLDVDMDRVAALAPDLVVAALSVPGMEKNVARLQDRGIRHVVCAPHGLADVWRDIALVAAACGVPERAGPVVAALQERVAAVAAAVAGAPRRRLYWEWWPQPLFSPGGRNWLTEISALAGGVNIFADHPGDCLQPTPQEVLARAPEFILAAWTGVWHRRIPLGRITGRPGWDRLPAVQAGQVHALEEGKFNRPSPRLVDGLEELARLLHPECFAGQDPQAGCGEPSPPIDRPFRQVQRD